MAESSEKGKRRAETRPPRGAVIVVAIGLLATIAAAALANENLSGESTELEWIQTRSLPDSKTAAVPGGGTMQLTGAGLRATGTNVSGYNLFRGAAQLRISKGAAVGSSRVLCAMRTSHGVEVAQTPHLRASYPRSSENLVEQGPYGVALVEFASKGSTLAVVELEDLPEFYATEQGIKLEWPPYTPRIEHWRYFLPPGPPERELVLPFTTVWRGTRAPSVEIDCTLTTGAGEVTVNTSGAMAKRPETIDEET